MVADSAVKQHGLKILKGMRVALKSIVLDFEDAESPTKP